MTPSSTQPGSPAPRSFNEFPHCPIDVESDPRAAPFLQGVQGNILKGHGRDHARVVFFRFEGTRAQNAQLLQEAVATDEKNAGRWVTSAWQQRDQISIFHQAEKFRARNKLGLELTKSEETAGRNFVEQANKQVFGGLAITRTGLGKLGYSSEEIKRMSHELHRGMKSGMEGQAPQAKFSAYWEEPYTEEFDGIFLFGCDDDSTLTAKVEALTKWLKPYGATTLALTESGTTWRDSDCKSPHYGQPREAFGFFDGISMPLFFKKNRLPQTTEPPSPPTWEWVNLGLENVFIPPPDRHAGGSFFALLKMEQNVKGFREHEREVARRIAARSGEGDAANKAEPLAIGRYRGGMCPAHRSPSPPTRRPNEIVPAVLNEFDFIHDAGDSRCPFHAHIRKMNPRFDDPSSKGTKEDFITSQPVRRGMLYDPRGQLSDCETANRGKPPEVWVWPESGVGLLFMAYMRNLGVQFEKLHNSWAKDTTFPTEKTGQVDPVLIGGDGTDWPHNDINLPTPPETGFVKRLGGAFFFVPSIAWLERGGT